MLLKFLVAFVFLLTSVNGFGAPPKAAPARALPGKTRAVAPAPAPTPALQAAIVKVDSAMVYDVPSFDGSVISYLPAGQKVRISLKTFATDLGQFYRIILANKKSGYIADIDVQPLKKKKSKKDREKAKSGGDDDDEDDSRASEEEQKEKAKEREQEKKERVQEAREERAEAARDAARDAQRAPVAMTGYVGPYIASWGFKEKISGIKAEERLTVFGVKYTTPKLVNGTILDFNFGFHFGAPSYYEQVSTSKPKGYLLFIDAAFLSPVIMAQDSFGYVGLGPLINYTAIRIESLNAPVDSNDLRLGLALTLGYSHRLGPVLGKIEGKYIIEKTQQMVFVLSVQAPL